MYFFFGNLIICSFAASVATLFFESPFIGLEKIIFGRTSSLEKSKKPSSGNNENNTTDKPLHSPEQTSLENESKLPVEDNHEKPKNGSISNPPEYDSRQNSYRHKSFDNVAYEP